MNKSYLIVMPIVGAAFVGLASGRLYERAYGPAARANADAIENCSAAHNVHLSSCEMQAVVITPRDELLKAPPELGGE